MGEMKDSFVLYTSIKDVLDELTDEEAGILFKAIVEYQATGEVPELPRCLKLFFITVKQDLDRNNEKYEETCRQRRENGKKGGRPKKAKASEDEEEKAKKPNGFEEKPKKPNGFSEKLKKQSKAKKADNEYEYDNEYDNENDTPDGVKETSKEKLADDLFAYLWSQYPVKRGKSQVSRKAKERLLDIGAEEMDRALQRYLSDLANDSDWRKPQNGSTFFTSGYVDYLDDNYEPTAKSPPHNKPKNPFLELLEGET